MTTISRRTLLRGAGAALALPWLGSLARAAAPKPPVRFAAFYFPNGVWEKDWNPVQPGADYELPFALQPLEKHRKDFIVCTGLDKAQSHSGDGHYAKTANYLTGLKVFQTTGKDLSVGGPSLDQRLAEAVGGETPLPSLELGIDPVISGIDSNVGFTRLYGSFIAWRAAGQPVAREIRPRAVYERLFGLRRAGTKSDDDRVLLDLVLDDARSLRGRLGRDDQAKFDEYLDAVRAVEKRIAFYSKPDPREWKPEAPEMAAPEGAPGDHRTHVRLMFDLIALAFRTNQTRIANDVSGRNFAQLIPGVNGGHHEFSHHEGKKEKYEAYSKIVRWHVEQFGYLLEQLKAVKENEGTLLDNSLLVFGSSISDGNRHDPANLPILLGGRGGGVESGRHLASPKKTPLCNLYLSILQRMGVKDASFGDSNAPLAI
jgi:hypothetical protein